jgi:hypothetical protein
LERYGEAYFQDRLEEITRNDADKYAENLIGTIADTLIPYFSRLHGAALAVIVKNESISHLPTLDNGLTALESYEENPFQKRVVSFLEAVEHPLSRDEYVCGLLRSGSRDAAFKQAAERFRAMTIPDRSGIKGVPGKEDIVSRIDRQRQSEKSVELKPYYDRTESWNGGLIRFGYGRIIFEQRVLRLQDVPVRFHDFCFNQIGISDAPRMESPESQFQKYCTHEHENHGPNKTKFSVFDTLKLDRFCRDLGLYLDGSQPMIGGRILDADISEAKVNNYLPLSDEIAAWMRMRPESVAYIMFRKDTEVLNMIRHDGRYDLRHFVPASPAKYSRIEELVNIPLDIGAEIAYFKLIGSKD